MKRFSVNLRAVVLLTVLLGACGREDSINSEASDGGRAVLISTVKAEVTDLQIWLESVGQVHSQSAPTLAAEVEGRITMVAVDAGERIEQGQLLAEIDTSSLLLQRSAAEAGIERLAVHIASGVRRVDRFEKLSVKNLSSQTQLDDAREQLEAFRADYKAAQAQLAIVNDSLGKSRVIAPQSGVIQHRLIDAGDFVKRGQALFEIYRSQQLQAWLPFPETVALQIQIGQTVHIQSPLTKALLVQGTITELKPAIGPGSRALMTITDIDMPGTLRPEATITGKVLVATHERAVMVPEISVVRRPGASVVYVINGKRVKAHPVTTGHHDNGRVEIVAGLKGVETVAVEGAAFLTDGANVKMAKMKGANAKNGERAN